MQKQSSAISRVGRILVYVLVAVTASYLFIWLTQLYVDLFGETYTPMAKFVASSISLIVCLVIVFTANFFSLKLNSKRLGVSLAAVIFLSLYIVGPGVRAPLTLYITSVSFPYNINMLLTIVLPLIFGRVLASRGV